jgi:DNA repair exonuclease SbcCD ATPase subunit
MSDSFTTRLQRLRNTIAQEKGERNILTTELEIEKKQLKKNKIRLKNIQDAQLITQHVAQQTQEELKFFLSDIVTVALDTVFDNPYEFVIDFVIKRGKTEAEIYFMRGGERMNPVDASGVGAIDVAAFALRVAVWKLANRYRNVLVLDEPFRFVSKNYLPNVSKMVKELSKKLKLQIIMITHIEEMKDCADKVFDITIKKGISKVKEKTK